MIVSIITTIDETAATLAVREAVTSVSDSPVVRQKLAWELRDRPALLTGDAVHGSPRLIALVERLRADGVSGVVMPPCPFCATEVRLIRVRDGLRCCRPCWEKPRTQVCARCGADDNVGGRDPDGAPLCLRCLRKDPLNHETCTGCGRNRLPGRRIDGRPFCKHCERPVATCATCHQTRPCHFVSTPTPI